ncbi:AI-2E family transporter [Psychrosphaera sp. B3R10]|uniref:AI-2E family transporter n=1 Tax=Psychrosphaera algicola TaxID=3023714 RepID=A0ABT5FJV6_9GAMM|nr:MULTISPECIES: AI-2E family transporter [unclassified Psychrosphaera]MBU2880879.1 AI-2E family transporter [Psychrosphaera sp. I2R16]MBU2990902.1 AI-2E family transporter [Psychrosphaera sp. B3R10]MDC2891484.1 AI-2E family transporter [Psychrosphaera sp. G1-22]MDO6720598.1 AI-2E family transporter [Psychrosphaera sp. 1_MG-2023]
MSKLEMNFATRFLFTMACLIILLAGIKAASAILVPFLLSMFIAIIANPLVNKLIALRIPRVFAVLIILSLLVGAGMSIAGVVGQSFNDFSQSLPVYQAKLSNELEWIVNKLALFDIHVDQSLLTQYFNPSIAMQMVGNLLSGFGGVMANLFLIILTVVFMLFEAPDVSKKVHIALDDPTMKMRHVDRFLESVNSYLAIKSLVSLGTATAVGVLLWILDIDYVLLWSVLAFLFNFIPNIGSIIAAVPAVLLAIVVQSPAVAGILALGYIAINTIFGNVIEPKFMGRGLGLSTLVVFLSLIFWGWLLGTVGMLLSVPLTMIVKIALEANADSRWLALLLSNVDDTELKNS